MDNLPMWLQVILGLIILPFSLILIFLPILLMGLGTIGFVYGIIPLLKTLVTNVTNKDLQQPERKKGLKRRAIIAGASFLICITGFILLRIYEAKHILDNPL